MRPIQIIAALLEVGLLINRVSANQNEDWVYWSSIGSTTGHKVIKRASLDGSIVQTLPLVPTLERFGGIAFDVIHGHLYAGDRGSITRANLDGSNPQMLLNSAVSDLELDLVHRKMYWSTGATPQGTSQLFRANLDGSSPQNITPSGFGFVEGIAVDPVAGRVYFASSLNGNTVRRIGYVGLDGSNPGTFKTLDQNAFDVEVDLAAGKIYWNEPNSSKIQRANLDGTGSTTVFAPPQGTNNGFGLDSLNSMVYFSELAAPNLARVKYDGTSQEVVVNDDLDGINYIEAVHIPDWVYWSTAGNVAGNKVIKRASLDGSIVQTLPLVPTSGRFGGIAFDVAHGYLYTGDHDYPADRGSIVRSNLDGSNSQILINQTADSAVSDLELDLVHQKIYWSTGSTSQGTSQLFRANLDGSSPQNITPSGFGFVEGIAVDPVGGRVYFASSSNGNTVRRIGYAGLDGSNPGTFKTLDQNAFDVEVDLAAGKIYWNEPNSSKIQRANLDGTGDTIVFAPPQGTNNGFGLDSLNSMVYFSELAAPNLASVKYDGTGHEVVINDDPDGINYIEVLNVQEAAGGVFVPADFNHDRFVDAIDFRIFASCATRASLPYVPGSLPQGCAAIPDLQGRIAPDFDKDNDVDMDDFGVFQRCIGGTSNLANPGCAN